MCISPDLKVTRYLIILLQILLLLAGALTANRNPIQKQNLGQYLLYVGQIFASVVSIDPILNTTVSLEFRMGKQLEYYAQEDPPPSRVFPTPVFILRCLNATDYNGTPIKQAII